MFSQWFTASTARSAVYLKLRSLAPAAASYKFMCVPHRALLANADSCVAAAVAHCMLHSARHCGLPLARLLRVEHLVL